MNENKEIFVKSDVSVQFSVTEQELKTSQTDASVTELEKWRPGFWRRFPWLGAGAILSVLLITTVQIIILVTSNGKATSQWNRPVIPNGRAKWPAPNVILSILNSLASISFTIAVGQGIAIAWWRKALKGTSIKELHNTWSFGASISAILLNLKYFNFAALAAVVTKLTIIDGVLFQRSTTTYTALGPEMRHKITTYPASHLPQTAYLNEFANDTSKLTNAFGYDIGRWLNSAYGSVYWTYAFQDCDGICALNISQPGYYATCSWHEEDVDLVASHPTMNGSVVFTNIFDINFNLTFGTPERNYTWIGLNFTEYSMQERDTSNSSARCPAKLYKTQCELRQSIIRYPVYLQRTTVATKSHKDSVSNINVYLGGINHENGTYEELGEFNYTNGQLDNFTWESWVDESSYSSPRRPWGPEIDGGFYEALKNQFTSQVRLKTNTTGFWSMEADGQYASLLEDTTNAPTYDGYICPNTFLGSNHEYYDNLNTLTFIAADDASQRPEWLESNLTIDDFPAYLNNSRVYQDAIQYVTEIHYETNFGFVYGALGSTLVCILLVLPVYWGFWELGRPVSLNPIEIATAFQAPMLVPLQPKTGYADDLVKVAGPYQVKYADVMEGPNGKRLRFVPSTTQPPLQAARDHESKV